MVRLHRGLRPDEAADLADPHRCRRSGDVSAGGVHIHHYVWGILLLLVVGAVGLVERSPRIRAWLGLGYGVGAALVVDEAALLLSLEDVYWDDEGGISIALALIVIGVAGSLLVLTRRPTEDSGG